MKNLKKKVQNVFETSYSSKCLKALDNIKKKYKKRKQKCITQMQVYNEHIFLMRKQEIIQIVLKRTEQNIINQKKHSTKNVYRIGSQDPRSIVCHFNEYFFLARFIEFLSISKNIKLTIKLPAKLATDNFNKTKKIFKRL